MKLCVENPGLLFWPTGYVGMLSVRPKGPTLEAQRAESGEGFFNWEGAASPVPHQLRGLGERCEWDRGRDVDMLQHTRQRRVIGQNYHFLALRSVPVPFFSTNVTWFSSLKLCSF